MVGRVFWSSAVLTGNRTLTFAGIGLETFWSSAVLTGNRTVHSASGRKVTFWSSAVLTGNRTRVKWISCSPVVLEQCRSDW